MLQIESKNFYSVQLLHNVPKGTYLVSSAVIDPIRDTLCVVLCVLTHSAPFKPHDNHFSLQMRNNLRFNSLSKTGEQRAKVGFDSVSLKPTCGDAALPL